MLKPDLYEAAKINDTEKVLKLLADQVPPTFIDDNNGWTVGSTSKCNILSMKCLKDEISVCYFYLI